MKKGSCKLFDLEDEEQMKKLSNPKNRNLKSAIEEITQAWKQKKENQGVDTDNEDVCFVCGFGGVLILCDG